MDDPVGNRIRARPHCGERGPGSRGRTRRWCFSPRSRVLDPPACSTAPPAPPRVPRRPAPAAPEARRTGDARPATLADARASTPGLAGAPGAGNGAARTLGAGASLVLTTNQPVCSMSNHAGDRFVATLHEPATGGDAGVLP